MSGMHRDRINGCPGQHRRFGVQLVMTVLFNGYLKGFSGERIYSGNLKSLCVPVLNCYACPGALGSCPVGALQTVIGGGHGSGILSRIPFYALGSLMLFGILLGRLVCGFCCPFGLIQDLLHRIPHRKIKLPERIDHPLRKLKYIILAVLVLLIPALSLNRAGVGVPAFCEYLCPAGTLEGGIPSVLAHPELRNLAGALFGWKALVLAAVVIGAVLIPRFFCRYLCPLGAFYGLFSRLSLYQINRSEDRCSRCGACSAVCPMTVDVTSFSGFVSSPECIRCGRCRDVCPEGAVTSGWLVNDKAGGCVSCSSSGGTADRSERR